MTKKTKKGFTLLELIVVMAIFSILMVGVMSLIQPVSNMFQSASMSEKTYSYANNVQEYLQTKLEYAEDVYIGTASKMGLTSDGAANDEKIAAAVEKFRSDHFKEVVKTPDGGSTIEYVNGKIHVVRLVNSNGTLRSGDPVLKGQITHRVYDFNSQASSVIDSSADVEEVAELNPAFLGARDSAYDFTYVLGNQNLVKKSNSTLNAKVDGSIKSGTEYKVLDNDFTNKFNPVSSSDVSLTIVLNKKESGTVECQGTDAGGNFDYRAFATPCTIQVVNLPLTNIAYRSGRNPSKAIGIPRSAKDKNGVVGMQAGDPSYKNVITAADPDDQRNCGDAFKATISDKINLDEDIYFIYCFTDEIES